MLSSKKLTFYNFSTKTGPFMKECNIHNNNFGEHFEKFIESLHQKYYAFDGMKKHMLESRITCCINCEQVEQSK